MIWLTWRQFRASAFILLGTATAAMLVLAATGHQIATLSDSSGEDFLEIFGADRAKATIFYASTAVVYILPAVVGVFWGAPMVSRELEAGTVRLVWTPEHHPHPLAGHEARGGRRRRGRGRPPRASWPASGCG